MITSADTPMIKMMVSDRTPPTAKTESVETLAAEAE